MTAEQNIKKVKESVEQLGEKVLRNELASHAFSVLGVCAVLLITSWLWIQSRQRFPKLPEGYYVGELRFPPAVEGGRGIALPLFIQSTSGDEFFVAVTRQGWEPQLVTYVERGDSGSDEWVHPIVLTTKGQLYRFTGAPDANGLYRGDFSVVDSDIEGTWKVLPITALPHSGWRMSNEALDHWLRLQQELVDARAKAQAAENRLQTQKAEVDQLTDFITDSDRLKERAEKRFLKVKSEWTAVKKVVDGLREEVKALERQVALAQRVTQYGSLVSLAREVLDRESRWVESMFRSDVEDSGAGFLNAVRYGERVMSLREQIAIEREKITNLRLVEERRTGIRREVESFDSSKWGE